MYTRKTQSRKNLSKPETEHSEIHHDEFGVESYYDITMVELKEKAYHNGVRIRAFSLTNGMGMILNVNESERTFSMEKIVRP